MSTSTSTRGRGRPQQPVPAELAEHLQLALDRVERAEGQLAIERGNLGATVRAALRAGASHRSIAAVLGCAHSHVGRLARGD